MKNKPFNKGEQNENSDITNTTIYMDIGTPERLASRVFVCRLSQNCKKEKGKKCNGEEVKENKPQLNHLPLANE